MLFHVFREKSKEGVVFEAEELGLNVSVVVRGERKQTRGGVALHFKFLAPLAGPGPLGLG